MAASIQIPTIFTAVDKFSGVVSQMVRGVKKFSKNSVAAVKRLDHRINNSFRRIGKIGSLVGGLTLGSLFGAAIQGNIQFNDSLASVSAITGATGQDLANLEQLAKSTAKETRKAGSEVLKAYELVGSAKPELLENAEALDGVTRSVITLSKASRMDLEESTKALTDVMNQFNLVGSESGKTIDILAAGAKFGAAAIPQISESIVQFGTVAKQSNVSLMESVAAIEVFASKGVKGAEAGTKIRNVLTTLATAKALPEKAQKELAKFGVNLDVITDNAIPLSKRLKEMSKISGDATAMVKVFGKENQGAGAILLNNINTFEDLTAKVGENGVAQAQAATNTNTFAFGLQSIKTAFINATTATNSNNAALDKIKIGLFWVADNMDKVLVVGASLIAFFVVWKTIVLATTVATAAATAATTAFSFALSLGLWPILAIIAAITAVVLIIKNWGTITDWFSKKWVQFTSWVSELWGNVVDYFKNTDLKTMFMDLGKTILKYMLSPLRLVLKLASNIPGKIGDMAGSALRTIDASLETSASGTDEVLPSTTQSSNEAVTKSITERNSNITLDILDKGGNVGNIENQDNIPINLGSTGGAF